MAATIFHGLDELRAAAGAELGPSDWLEITQDRVDRFAEATGDRQWIHLDPRRAAVDGPFGTTIAHGYLTLSLVAQLATELMEVYGVSMSLNYGTNRVRFPAPVRVGSRIRARERILSVEDVPGGVQVAELFTVEIEGVHKPACVVETLSRYLD